VFVVRSGISMQHCGVVVGYQGMRVAVVIGYVGLRCYFLGMRTTRRAYSRCYALQGQKPNQYPEQK
jgi:hypothetical protein